MCEIVWVLIDSLSHHILPSTIAHEACSLQLSHIRIHQLISCLSFLPPAETPDEKNEPTETYWNSVNLGIFMDLYDWILHAGAASYAGSTMFYPGWSSCIYLAHLGSCGCAHRLVPLQLVPWSSPRSPSGRDAAVLTARLHPWSCRQSLHRERRSCLLERNQMKSDSKLFMGAEVSLK